MPAKALNPDQSVWTLQFLKILGKASASEEVDLYGTAYQEIDQRPLFTELNNALQPNVPPQMISSEAWLKASMGPKEPEKTGFNAVDVVDKLNKGGVANQELTAATDKALKVIEALKVGLPGPWPLDLSPPPEVINQPTTVGQLNALTNRKTALINDYQTKKATADECQTAARACMPFMDAPANNPERQVIGQRLKELEELEKDLAKKKKPLSKDDLAAHMQQKGKKLHELERDLFAWNNRRVQQNLPPNAEAVGMADLLQRVHQQMVSDIIDNDLDIPVADADKLSPEEAEELQKTWRTLKDDTFRPTGTAAKGKLLVAPTQEPPADTPEKLKQFRVETLSNFVRLMGSPGGRHLVKEINSRNFPVEVKPTTADKGASCTRIGGGHLRSAAGIKGGGGQSAVNMVLGAKDSDVGLGTASGNKLFAPRFIAMGHELIHALHNSRGSNRREVPLPGTMTPEEKKHWNNAEEYRTIFEGKTSEQTLRTQYGLSAERFGHMARNPHQEVFNSLKETLEAQTALTTPGNSIDRTLKNYGWDPDKLADKLKVDLAKEIDKNKAPTNQLATGWDVNQLTIEQIKGICAQSIPFKLRELYWTPHGLSVERLKQITDTSEHNPRSPLYLRYKKLGEKAALDEIPGFNAATGSKLSVGKDTDWPTKVQALVDAENLLATIAAINPALKAAAETAGKLQAKLKAVATAATGGTAGGNVKEMAIEKFWEKLTAADHSKLTPAALTGKYGDRGMNLYQQITRNLNALPDLTPLNGKPAAERAQAMKTFAEICPKLDTACAAAVSEWIDTTPAERLQSNFGSKDPAETFKKNLKKDVQDIGAAARAMQKMLAGVASLV
jgi:hypothetical protein